MVVAAMVFVLVAARVAGWVAIDKPDYFTRLARGSFLPGAACCKAQLGKHTWVWGALRKDVV